MPSANVTVFVNDQSIYSEPTPTTIPLFVVATRSNKPSESGLGTAPGTAESNVLRLYTSQRELLNNMGTPVFVTSAGEPVHGDETNEYGLLAAHSFMGRASRAFFIRADIDLGQLVPTDVEPVLPPPDGTYWIDSDEVVGGIFTWNGASWLTVPFSVALEPVDDSEGSDGDWLFDYSTQDGTIRFKNNGVWYAASDANIQSNFGAGASLWVSPTTPVAPVAGDYWYKTVSNAGGTDLKLRRFRAADQTWIIQAVIRDTVMPPPNEGTIWEDISRIPISGARPLYVGTGDEFINLPVFVQPEQPVSDPDVGTLWFNDDLTDFALYVEGTDNGFGNQWVPVETVTVANPTSLEKVISASPPQFPNVGAIWVDLSTPENVDNFPVIKRWNASIWEDISDSVITTDEDPIASVVLNGSYWLNLGERRTTNIVRAFNPDYIPDTVIFNQTAGEYQVVPQTGNPWEPNSGTKFGRKAQRDVVVEALQATLTSVDELRAEDNYYQLISCPGYPEVIDEMNALNTDIGEVAFVVADGPKWMVPNGIPEGREITVREWITNANNVATTGEEGYASGRTAYSAIWYPWCLTTNVDGEDVFQPASHMALRTLVYSDQTAAPWFPPAGFTRGRVDNATSVGYLNNDGEYKPIKLIKGQRDVIYENDINPIAFMPNRGLTVWGQKTLSPISSALDRINVSRLIVKMRYDLARLLEPFLFELNDPVTRRSAQVVTERYLAGLKSLRALYDYAVRCDESNNPDEVIDANELYVDVAIKPAKAIEFIFVPITVLNTGDEFPF